VPTLTKRLPKAWKVSGNSPEGSSVYIDSSTAYLDKSSVLLSSPRAKKDERLLLMQSIDGNAWYGKRLRFSCFVKTKSVKGHATILVSIQAPSGMQVVYDPMLDRSLQGDNEWTELSVVIDVPTNGRWITFGPCLWGKGKLWAAQFKIDEVSNSVPRTDDHGGEFVPPHPLNLSFSETICEGLKNEQCPLAAGWQTSPATDGLKFAVLENAFEGNNVALINSIRTPDLVDVEDRFGYFCQSFQAKPFRGHRFKFSSMIKTEAVEGRVVLVLMVNGVHYKRMALSTMSAEPLTGDNDWASYSQVLDVSQFAYSITIWLQITGIGKAYFANVEVMAVDDNVPTTDGHHHPENLDFSE